jgi:branched-chain amino acid transport system ATP-binding protein/branched-chain amino acid transport system permease protein
MTPAFRILIFALVMAAFPLIPGLPRFWIVLADNIGLAALVAMGLVLLTGVGGLTSFGQAAFCGFGAYTTALLTTAYGLSPWLTLPLSLIVSGGAAVLLGLITVRLSGHYLPLGTIAWGLSLYYIFSKIALLGRNDGISSIPPLAIGNFQLLDIGRIYYAIWIAVFVAAILTLNLLDSRTGRAIRALRRGHVAAESFGVSTARAKLFVFIYAAVLAGLSGWLYAHFQRAVNPTPFGIDAGIEYLFIAVVGGAGHVWGAVLGAAIVTVLKYVLQDTLPALFQTHLQLETIVFGMLLVLLLQVAPSGVWPRLAALLPPSLRARDGTGGALPQRDKRGEARTLLAVRNLTRRFGGLVAVNDVSFDVTAGQILALIGPNGAGKSTTFNMITGVLQPTSGTILLDGKRIDEATPQAIARLGVARTFQHVKLVPDMSVEENVALGAYLRGHSSALASMLRLDRADEAALRNEARTQLARVGLADAAHLPAASLPLGQQRLVEIARALANDPILLLLDEPAAGLRHREKTELAGLLRKLRDEGVTVVLVEHDMGFVMDIAERIVVLDFGTRIAEGTADEVRTNPAVIAAYLGVAA